MRKTRHLNKSLLIQLELESIIDEASLFASCLQLVTDEEENEIRISNAPKIEYAKVKCKRMIHNSPHSAAGSLRLLILF